MIPTELLKVNEPNVVHETIDGETILLDLNSGNYFSLDGPGAIIWDYIAKKGDRKKVIALMTGENTKLKEEIEITVMAFVAELINENLLVKATDELPPDDTSEIEEQLKKSAKNFTAPKVNKYSDMQDLLLLDPIHDVDEKGWPESKDGLEDDQGKK